MKGKVRWFSNPKGYGFILSEKDKDVFCHFSAILADGYKSLKEGDNVEFDIIQGSKGDQAANVKVINEKDDEVKVTADK
jgi:CspA family cold shock protein